MSDIKTVISSGNIYKDLVLPNPDGMLRKAELVTKLSQTIKRKGLTRAKAGKLLGIPQSKLSAILRGQFQKVSERRLMDCLTRLGDCPNRCESRSTESASREIVGRRMCPW